MIETGDQALDPAVGDPRVIFQRAGNLAGLLAQLPVEIAELGLQFLDARVQIEQRRGLFGELRAQRHPLFGQAADQFGIEHLGSLDRLAALQHLLDQPRLGLGIRLQRAGVVQLRVDLAHLLIGQRGVVGADEQARLRAKILDARFGVGHLLAQIFNFTRQPQAGRLRLLLPRVLLQRQVAFGDGVGDTHRKLRIARLEFDDDDAGLVDRIGREALVIGIEHALFRAQRERIAPDSEQGQHRFQRRKSLQHRIEFRALGKLVLPDDLAGQIARLQQLDLAGHGFGVQRGAFLVALAVRPQEDIFAPIDQDAGFGFVPGGDHVDGGDR